MSPKEALLDSNNEQYTDNALLSDSHDDLSCQFPPVEGHSRHNNTGTDGWLGPHDQTKVEYDWYLPFAEAGKVLLEPQNEDRLMKSLLEIQNKVRLEVARHEHDDQARLSLRDYAPESTPFTHDSSPFADDKQAQDAQQITEFKNLLQSNDLSLVTALRTAPLGNLRG